MDKNMRHTDPALQHDPLEAAHALGSAHCVAAIARTLGISRTVLANKLNPSQDFHKLSLGEAVAITDLTRDERILEAWAMSRGKVLVALPEAAGTEEELADQLLLVQELLGAVCGAIREARADGVIDANERAAIRLQATAVVREVLNLDAEVGARVRPLAVRTAS